MAQEVSRRPFIAENWVQFQAIPCGICSGQCGSGTVCLDLQWTVWQRDSLFGFAVDSVAVGQSLWICSGQYGSGTVCLDLQWTVWQWDSLFGFAVDSVAVGQSVWTSPTQYFASAPYSFPFIHCILLANDVIKTHFQNI